ncbi:uncharacterized protein LOC131690422 [Topomyia yanbarensis]|uniref:uncharacterized protein LOC131690422 n=1 Tax=Topomyia yanbarensis TaxID=2498891 RepID=UPI00273B6469|nr:uncharacterized protein LOC131690422 [Topomyia yanbarensis]
MAAFTGSFLVAVLIIAIGATVIEATPTPPKSKFSEYKQICGKLLRTPAEDLEQYLQSEYTEKHDTFCFIRCVSILHGTYDDETGVNLAKMYENSGDGLTEQEFTEQAKTCLEPKEGDAEETCYCRKAWKPIWCIRKQYLDRKKGQQEAATDGAAADA